MSSIGSDPDEYTPGNQPDGSYYNLFPESSQPGLIGGQYADMLANAPPAGMNSDFSGDGTGLPPSVAVAPNLPQQSNPSSGPAPIGPASAPGIDYSFLSGGEGGQHLIPYAPGPLKNPAPADGGDDLGAGVGVTIGTGVDLGAHSIDDLKRWGVSGEAIAKLQDAMGKKGNDARNWLAARKSNMPAIGAADAQAMDQGALNDTVDQVRKNYDQATRAGAFDSLDHHIRTAIVDLAYQYGTNLAGRTPKFWGDATRGDWNAAVGELNNFGDHFASRRKREAVHLQQGLPPQGS